MIFISIRQIVCSVLIFTFGKILCFLESDALSNLITIVALICAVRGGQKLIKYYEERRLDSMYNFYFQMKQHVFYFKELIEQEKDIDLGFHPAFYLLSKNANHSLNFSTREEFAKKHKTYINKIYLFTNDFINFLLKSPNQLPENTKKERTEWKEKRNNLTIYLMSIKKLHYDETIDSLEVKQGAKSSDELTPAKILEELNILIKRYIGDLTALLVEIELKIETYEEKTLLKMNM